MPDPAYYCSGDGGTWRTTPGECGPCRRTRPDGCSRPDQLNHSTLFQRPHAHPCAVASTADSPSMSASVVARSCTGRARGAVAHLRPVHPLTLDESLHAGDDQFQNCNTKQTPHALRMAVAPISYRGCADYHTAGRQGASTHLQHLELRGTRSQDDMRVALLGDGVDDQLCAIVCGYNTVHHLQDPPEKNQSHFHGRPGG
jgi:hypothetical protein